MVYKDGGVFTEYCSKPYDQNDYDVYLNDGRAIRFTDYMVMREFWWGNYKSGQLSHVEVVEKAKKKVSKKGF